MRISEVLPIRLMFVDDQESIRQIMEILLQTKVAEYREATNGEEALQKLQDFDADVVITDIGMPLIDGIVLAKHIRAKDMNKEKKTCIIATTAYSKEDKSELGDDSLFDYVLKKPISPLELLELLEQI